MLNVYKMSDRNLLSIGAKFLFDKKYRARIFQMYHAYTNGFKAETAKSIQVAPELLKKSYYFIGGCELHPIVQFLDESKVREKYFTFEHGGSPFPHFELSDPRAECHRKPYDVFVVSQAQEFRLLVQEVQLAGLSHSREEILADLDACVERLRNCVDRIEEASPAALVFLYGYAVSYLPALGIFEYKMPMARVPTLELLNRYNEALYEIARHKKHVYVLDHSLLNQRYLGDDFVRPHSQDGIYDHLSQDGYSKVIQLFLRQLHVLLVPGKRVKCLVCDLDNTLWHGVLQDLGPDGITIRENCVNVLKMLSRRGILLAACSKNEPDVADRLKDILGNEFHDLLSVVITNWEPKSKSILEIARLLEIGVDSMAIIDDSDFEREQVKQLLPDVAVYHENEFSRLLTYDEFEPSSQITEESAGRAVMYKQQARRKKAESSFQGEYVDFLKSCEMKLSLALAEEGEVPRIAELINRTNQLNTSLKRFSAVEIGEMIRRKDSQILRLKVKDKFGDYGLVGVVIVASQDRQWTIDLLTLSCRVMGRGVEAFLFQWIKAEAARHAIQAIQLDFRSTDRNTAMQNIVIENGFRQTGGGSFSYAVRENEDLVVPEWFEFTYTRQ